MWRYCQVYGRSALLRVRSRCEYTEIYMVVIRGVGWIASSTCVECVVRDIWRRCFRSVVWRRYVMEGYVV